eukprot:398415-Rhodomonas_salina.1
MTIGEPLRGGFLTSFAVSEFFVPAFVVFGLLELLLFDFGAFDKPGEIPAEFAGEEDNLVPGETVLLPLSGVRERRRVVFTAVESLTAPLSMSGLLFLPLSTSGVRDRSDIGRSDSRTDNSTKRC